MGKINIGYPTYAFSNQDPVIDELYEIFRESGISRANLANGTNLALGTLGNWWDTRETKRPQSASIEACGRFFGKKRVWVDIEERGYKAPHLNLEVAKAQAKKLKEERKKRPHDKSHKKARKRRAK